jgi:hypothetical protein
MARRPAVDRAAEASTRTAADPSPRADGDANGNEARPGKWASLFRHRPKDSSAARPSAPRDDDMPVPRWVNGRWESR